MVKQFVDRYFLARLTRDEEKVRRMFMGMFCCILLLLVGILYVAVQSLKKEHVVLPQTLPLVSQSPKVTIAVPTPIKSGQTPDAGQSAQVVQQDTNSVKEYFIPFGAGTNQSSDWTDVPGLVSTLDFGNYSHIKEIHFEASVGIPTANESASVRLFNETDKHPVWYSEITLTNGQFVSSSPIVYDTGVKTYQVQMKTSLQYTANLIQSRLHIILQ